MCETIELLSVFTAINVEQIKRISNKKSRR